MILVYASCKVQATKVEKFKKLAAILEKASPSDKGCQFYRCGQEVGAENTFVFVERWDSMADLEAHMQQPHFTEYFPQIQEILEEPANIKLVEC
ncbi:putative quinol monooxygenase [Psittacicella hinzii]|uniref:ABM domain-containing protein n=1 Tax=Psittacicella hinzii TaxID=2028575 RepID=A0A3A1YKP4_9GAMM|nr:putative quinol monooxygenase [Psittacicella hinzii]RIY36814.1 hypothetical protein CKF58_05570 [Psittacicella hinzii]